MADVEVGVDPTLEEEVAEDVEMAGDDDGAAVGAALADIEPEYQSRVTFLT